MQPNNSPDRDEGLMDQVIDRVLANYSQVEPCPEAVAAWVARAKRPTTLARANWPRAAWLMAAAACGVVVGAGGGAGSMYLRLHHVERLALPQTAALPMASLAPTPRPAEAAPAAPKPPKPADHDTKVALAGENTRMVLIPEAAVHASVRPAWQPFPAPQPLNQQEKLMLRYQRQFPRQWNGIMNPLGAAAH